MFRIDTLYNVSYIVYPYMHVVYMYVAVVVGGSAVPGSVVRATRYSQVSSRGHGMPPASAVDI